MSETHLLTHMFPSNSARTVGELLDLLRKVDPATPIASDSVMHILNQNTSPTYIRLPSVPTERYNFNWDDKFKGNFRSTEACMAGFMAIQSYRCDGKPRMQITEEQTGCDITYPYTANYHPLIVPEPMMFYTVTVTGLTDTPIKFGFNTLDFLRGLHMATMKLDLDLHLNASGGETEDKDFWDSLDHPHIHFDEQPEGEQLCISTKLDRELKATRASAVAEDLSSKVAYDLEEMGFTPPANISGFMHKFCDIVQLRYLSNDEGKEADSCFERLHQAALCWFGETTCPALPYIYGAPLALPPTLSIDI